MREEIDSDNYWKRVREYHRASRDQISSAYYAHADTETSETEEPTQQPLLRDDRSEVHLVIDRLIVI